MKKLLISFSGRKDGNCDEIAEYLAENEDKVIYFRDMNFHYCSNCDYECFSDYCKYHNDDIYSLYGDMTNYQKIVMVVPMYSGNPSSLYFIFNERGQDYFKHNEEKYGDIIKKLFIIGIYGDSEQSPDLIPCLEKCFNYTDYSNHVLGIERHKYNLRLKDSILHIEKIKNSIDEFINPKNAKLEESAMAVVICKDKILATKEIIYGKKIVSLPKGHIENNETPIDAAIRECFEETNILINESNLVKQLTAYSYEFLTPSNKLVRKTLKPYLFVVNDFGNPLSKEDRILSVNWLKVEEFLTMCPYDNVKNTVKEFLNSEAI